MNGLPYLVRAVSWLVVVGLAAFERGEIISICRDGSVNNWQQVALLGVIVIAILVAEIWHVSHRSYPADQ